MIDADSPDPAQTAATETRSPDGPPVPRLVLGPYELVQRIGEGGMGEVWLARQTHPLKRQVAVKLVKAGMDTRHVIARFEAERQALALMTHPWIARIFDAGATPEGRPYFVMEYVRGEPITDYCDRVKLSLPARLALFSDVCEAVQHAHQKGVVHRDLKSSNVLVTTADGKAVPRIIDFGIAKAVTQPLTEKTLFTEIGSLIGTPEYMSPEQADANSADVDTRTDIYSLGIILYQMLTGVLPFDSSSLRSGSADDVRRVIREKEATRASRRVALLGESAAAPAASRQLTAGKLANALKGDLDWITIKCLEKDRDRRYPSAEALAQDVRRHLRNEAIEAAAPSAIYRARKFVRRHRFGVAVAASAAMLLIGFAAVTARQASRIAEERDRANQEATTAAEVTDFVTALFNISDPSEARGNSLTAREVLDSGSRKLASGLKDQPVLRSRLQVTIGVVYTSLGLLAAAEPLLVDALAADERLLGKDHPQTIRALHQLANLRWHQGQYPLAESLYRTVAESRTRQFGATHPDTLKAQFDLASTYMQTQQLDRAETLARQTLELQRVHLGPTHGDTLLSINNLASMYRMQQRFPEAEPLTREVFMLMHKTLGPDHPDTLVAESNLALLLANNGQLAEAEPLHLHSIREQRRVLGPRHPHTLTQLGNLAALYSRSGRLAEAEQAALEAYEGFAAIYGPSHERTLRMVRGFGQDLRALEKAGAIEAVACQASR